jgi:hypothetical protein
MDSPKKEQIDIRTTYAFTHSYYYFEDDDF